MVVQDGCSDVDFCRRVLVTGLVQLSKELNQLDVGQAKMVERNAERRTTQVMSVRQRQYGISSLAKRRLAALVQTALSLRVITRRTKQAQSRRVCIYKSNAFDASWLLPSLAIVTFRCRWPPHKLSFHHHLQPQSCLDAARAERFVVHDVGCLHGDIKQMLGSRQRRC